MSNPTSQLNGVNPTTGVRSPKPQNAVAPGSYEWNAFAATLVVVSGNPQAYDVQVAAFDISNGILVPVLLFLNDRPIYVLVQSEYAALDDAQGDALPAPASYDEVFALDADIAGRLGGRIYVADGNLTSPVSEGQVSQGTLFTSGVQHVTGFGGTIRITDRGIQSGGQDVDPSLNLHCVGDSGVVHGPPLLFDDNGLVDQDPQPVTAQSIIMNEAAYTQAIRAGVLGVDPTTNTVGNSFVDAAGVKNVVVGLWGPQFAPE